GTPRASGSDRRCRQAAPPRRGARRHRARRRCTNGHPRRWRHGTPASIAYYPSGMPLIEPGKKAPAFALKDQNGELHRLSDYAGRPVVLYFYPKDDTPGCTKESCDFQALLPTYKRRKAAVLGVSILDEKS